MNRDLLKKLVLEQMKGAAVQRLIENKKSLKEVDTNVSGFFQDRQGSEPTPESLEPEAFKDVKAKFPRTAERVGDDILMKVVEVFLSDDEETIKSNLGQIQKQSGIGPNTLEEILTICQKYKEKSIGTSSPAAEEETELELEE